MKPTEKERNEKSKFDVIYDKLKLLNHKAYELMIKFRDTSQTDYEMEWKKNQSFIKDAMKIIDDGRGSDLTKKDFEKLNDMWMQCKHINV